jgi:hypothetical protein
MNTDVAKLLGIITINLTLFGFPSPMDVHIITKVLKAAKLLRL